MKLSTPAARRCVFGPAGAGLPAPSRLSPLLPTDATGEVRSTRVIHEADERSRLGSPRAMSREKNALKRVVVGATRVERAASWTQTRRSTRLSYAPTFQNLTPNIMQGQVDILVVRGGIEPPTNALSGRYSTPELPHHETFPI